MAYSIQNSLCTRQIELLLPTGHSACKGAAFPTPRPMTSFVEQAVSGHAAGRVPAEALSVIMGLALPRAVSCPCHEDSRLQGRDALCDDTTLLEATGVVGLFVTAAKADWYSPRQQRAPGPA